MNLTPLVIFGLAIASSQIVAVSSVCTSTGSGCLSSTSSCRGRPDGDYQACEGCTFYHSCSGGVLYANRPCPLTNQGGIGGRLVWLAWTSNQGICDYTSSTCRECVTGPVSLITPVCTNGRTGPNCITASTSCVGKPDGDYQACESCTIYHSCSGGVNWSNRPCARTNYGGLRGYLVWNSWTANRGICDYTSTTCTECSVISPPSTCNSGTRSGTACITRDATSCVSKSNGDYQACEGCTFYHTCSNGIISADRPCARRSDGSLLVWVTESAGRGHCDYTSATCSQCP
jgi:hypothetical protein